MTETPDFLQRHGITALRDNLGDGRLNADAAWLARLFGDDFIHAVQNNQLKEQHTENEK